MRRRINLVILLLLLGLVLQAGASTPVESAAGESDSEADDTRQQADSLPWLAPDIRKDDTRLKLQDGNFVAVPIPMSNPTLDTGLIAGAAYFYPQTPEQQQAQPASLTGLGGMYTSNESKALVLFQQNYWGGDRWRFTGAAGAADVRLSLLAPETTGGRVGVDWRIDGSLLFARLARRVHGDWYLGGELRVISADQSFSIDILEQNFDYDARTGIRGVGLGLTLEYDSRDLPTGPRSGRQFTASVLVDNEAFGSRLDYESYAAAYRSYHPLKEALVLAWELEACRKQGRIPIWDACRIPLRGFSAFDYLGDRSAAGQAELRWRVYKRWGLVGFAGYGRVENSFALLGDGEGVGSYGLGLRYEILPAKRLNIRLDFARSDDSNGVYLSVGEAF